MGHTVNEGECIRVWVWVCAYMCVGGWVCIHVCGCGCVHAWVWVGVHVGVHVWVRVWVCDVRHNV